MIGLAAGWAILHSLWQGTIVALLLAFAFGFLRSSRSRYAAACLGMLVILIAFALTFAGIVEWGASSHITASPHGLPTPPDVSKGDNRSGMEFRVETMLPWITRLWIVGVVLFHLHSFASWVAARRLLRRGVCTAAELWQDHLHVLLERLQISRPVVLLESCLANVPVVIGYLRPVILIPAGLLAGMPARQIEAILLHELAHIRRLDYLVNLLQTVVEGFLFYHPAIWWISRVIRTEREHCCDDLAVAATGDAREYAAALSALAQSRWAASQTALAANGGNLMKRVRRLLYPLETPHTGFSPAMGAAVLTITAALALTAWQTASQNAPPERNPYQLWLTEDVVYIITDMEREAFKALQTDQERDYFVEQFWLRRDPTPGTVQNEAKEEHYRRIAYANTHFWDHQHAGWNTDRGRIYIVYGPPDEIESHPAASAYKRPAGEGGGVVNVHAFDQWRYAHIEGIGDNVIMEFVDRDGNGEYHMTLDPDEKDPAEKVRR